MKKTHLKNVAKLDDGTFAQWRTVIKSILIKEGEWKVVSGHTRPYVPRNDDTSTVINTPGGSADSLVYDLENKTIIGTMNLRNKTPE